MNEIAQFETPCRYRDGGMYCSNGFLYVFEGDQNRIASLVHVENQPVECPACHGTGYVLTPAGQQLVNMLWRHLESRVTKLIEDVLEGS